MTTSAGATKRVLAWISVAAMLLMAVPTWIMSVQAVEDTRVADVSTMDDWKQYFGQDVLSTDNAGGVWTDKSVFTQDDAFEGTGVTLDGIDKDSFLVALSAIASNKAVSGYSNRPTDTVMVLDVSGSMNTQDKALAKEMVNAANTAIARLHENNPYNRVGVVLYAGEAGHETNDNAAQVVLPLGRYLTASDGCYLQYTDGEIVSVGVDADVRDADNGTALRASSKEVAGATYIQKGLILGMDQLLAADTALNDPIYGMISRVPVMMVLSDGAPTLASTSFIDPGQYDLGDGQIGSSTDAQGFVTQLTAAYVKAQVETHYKTDCKVYTLGLGVSKTSAQDDDDKIAISVLDPSRSTGTITSFWTQYNRLEVGQTMTVQGGDSVRTVTKIAIPLDMQYVDEFFEVTEADSQVAENIADAFAQIVGEIQLQSGYSPTLVETNEDYDGYISFVDRVGRYMEVTDIKGILLDNTLYSGEMLAKNFVPGGGALGTFDAPTALGHDMVAAVRDRIGIATHEEAAALIGLAYQHGQIAYNKQTGAFSNYIGWYANAAGEFLGFWYDGIETMPDPADPTLTEETRPAYIMKSYGFLGNVNEVDGVSESDMMYVIVQERREIASGDTLMAFGVPASLIPLVTYNVELAEDNETVRDLTVTGAEYPIRLVYEVALRSDISEYTVSELVEEDYAYREEDGSYRFYTNQWETSTAYGTINAYSYFVPSKQNERYYYTEDSLLYEDTAGTLCTGEKPDVNGTYYRAYTVYNPNGSKTVYEPASSLSIGAARENEDGYWYVPAGTVHTYMDGFVCHKEGNASQTLPQYNIPFVDARYNYYVGATFGNNGVVCVKPATGIVLSKTLTKTVKGAQDSFTFTVTAVGEGMSKTAVYDTLLLREDGTQKEDTLRMTNGTATVTLKANEQLFIVGMKAGDRFAVFEEAHELYKTHTINGATASQPLYVTIKEGVYQQAAFVNAPKLYGDLILIKRVTHDFGESYELPYKAFDIQVDLGAAFAGQTIRALHSADEDVTSVKTDANGQFIVSLAHGERFELFDLPEGTVAKVTELTSSVGFTPSYYVSGVLADGSATVMAQTTVSVIIADRYTPSAVTAEKVFVKGTKTLIGRENDAWEATDFFTVELQAYTANGWETIATQTVDAEHQSYDFREAMTAQVFDVPGHYSFRITEKTGDDPTITYDPAVYPFTVVVGDTMLDGQLRVVDVVSPSLQNIVSGDAADGFTVTADFSNMYACQGQATAVIDIRKALENPSDSDLATLSGYCFGLYESDTDTPTFVSPPTDHAGDTRLTATFTETGTYTYTLKEQIAQDAVGMLFDDRTYTVEIVVSEDTNGVLTAQTTVLSDTEVTGEILFTNTYAPEEAVLTIPVSVMMNGRALRDGECAVRVEQNGQLLASGTNTVDGTVVFDNAIGFDTVGDAYLDIIEIAGDARGVSYDPLVRRVHVHVADSGNGYLTAHYHLINETGDTVEFVNTYTPAFAELLLGGTKTLTGRRLLNDEFDFVLIENKRGGLMMDTHNLADGSFSFDPIVYDEVGEYEYWIQEAKAGDPNGILYDMTEYTVKVSVTDDGNGALCAAVTSITNGTEEVSNLHFENVYQAQSTQVTLGGTKTLTGRALTAGEFGFALYEMVNGERGECLQVAYNDTNGAFAFEPIVYQTAGTYRYVACEENYGQTINGVAYDDTVYHVVVYVEEDGHGKLTAEQVIMGDDDVPVDSFLFENRYAATEAATVTLNGKAVLDGREMAEGEFTFLLYSYAEDGTLSAEPIASTTNAADGTFAFAPMSFEERGDHLYRIVQDVSANGRGITYDTVAYDIFFTVRDGKDGAWKASKMLITETGGTSVLTQAVFINTYTPGSDSLTVPITVEKTIKHTDDSYVTPEGFVFELRDSDEEDTVTVTSDANGKATFDVTLTKADAGQTFTFEVCEINDGRENIIYSTAVYTVEIAVSLDVFGDLEVALTCNGETVEELRLAFENVYEATATSSEPTSTTTTAPTTSSTDSEGTVTTATAVSSDTVLTTITAGDTAKPDGPKDDAPYTGGPRDTVWWMLLALSGAIVLTATLYHRKKIA